MPIEGSAVPSEWGQTVWSSRAFLSKQTGMIGVVEKRLKNCFQWIRWSTQRPLCAVRARRAVACWRAVRWGSSAAWRCQRCHIEGHAQCQNTVWLFEQPRFRKQDCVSNTRLYWQNTAEAVGNQTTLQPEVLAVGFYKALVHCGSVEHTVDFTVLYLSCGHKWHFVSPLGPRM